MKKRCVLTGLAMLFMAAFAYQPPVPLPLQGKWKLNAGNKLIGSIEFRNDGKYNYAVLPNYREAGSIVCGTGARAREIDLVAQAGGKNSNVTRGIYRIIGNTLTLCLASANEARPVSFNGSGNAGSIAWTGTK